MGNMVDRQINERAFSFGTHHDDTQYLIVLEIDELHIENIHNKLKEMNNALLKPYINDIIISLHYFMRIDPYEIKEYTKMYLFHTQQTRLLKIIMKNAKQRPNHPGILEKYIYRKCALYELLRGSGK